MRGTGNFNSFQYIGNFGGALVTGAVWESSQQASWLIVLAAGFVGFLLVTFDWRAKKSDREGKTREG